jgi:Flp pilus assembly protein TadG
MRYGSLKRADALAPITASPREGYRRRSGVAAVELAILLPLLTFLFVISIDYARIFYYSVTIENCARNGALYGSDPIFAAQSPYTSISQAALADATNLNPPPSVTSTNGTDKSGNTYVQVTVSWQFQTITNYPGVPDVVNLNRTVEMRIAPILPK